jgi:hypothetical protein
MKQDKIHTQQVSYFLEWYILHSFHFCLCHAKLLHFKLYKLSGMISGYSSAVLAAIIVGIPFAVRVLLHNESGPWEFAAIAFFHTYLELYFGNACLGKTYEKNSRVHAFPLGP